MWPERLIPVGAWLIALVLWLLKWTTRKRVLGGGEEAYGRWERGEQMILAFWHEQLVMMPLLYAGPRVCIMVSRHRDGELIARAIRPFGIEAIRGSSTRGWSGALKGMLRAFRGGADLAVAPDGPRGPRRVAKSGVLQLARATGAPVVPVAAAAAWCRRLASWDRLVIPLPLGRLVYVAGTPLTVSPDASPTEVEARRGALEHELNRLTALAEAAVAQRGTDSES